MFRESELRAISFDLIKFIVEYWMIMAASHVRRIINSQVARLREIQLIGDRLLDQPNEAFITS
jgi:hypothetical protein